MKNNEMVLYSESLRTVALGQKLKPVSLYGTWKIKIGLGSFLLENRTITLLPDRIVFALPYPLRLIKKLRERRLSEVDCVEIRTLKFDRSVSNLVGIRLKAPAKTNYYYDSAELKYWIQAFRKAGVLLKFIDCAEVDIG